MQSQRTIPAQSRLPTRYGRAGWLAAAALVAALAAGWAWGRLEPVGTPPTGVRAGSAEAIARRVEVAVADAEAVWRRSLAPAARPARLTFFSTATAADCAGGATVSGPFYCPETGTAAFDLGFLDAFGARLDRQRDLALTLYAVRVAAEHLQRELGLLDAAALELIGARRGARQTIGTTLALQADCLTGAWAAAASPRIGRVPDTLYDRMVWSARNLVGDLQRTGVRVPRELDPFAATAQPERAAAFLRGYAAGRAADCLAEG
jgi:predicted metalloprotease